uniref:Claudin n=1 Tax=Oncorhynchus kisutch TaxID=8019 RepID=A0A8C7F315_ONCKI
MKHRTVMMYMEIEYWTWSEVGSVVLTTSNYFPNLWKDCVSDSTGVSDCKEYPSMLGLPVFLYSVRALSICSIILGFLTGSESYTVYAFKFFLFEIGAAFFIGWGGSLLLITGGFVLSFFSGKEGLRSTPRRPNSYATARTRRTYRMTNSSRVTPMPQLVQGSRGGRRIRTTRTTGEILFELQ